MKFLFQTQLDSVPSNYHRELDMARRLYHSVQIAFPHAEVLTHPGQDAYFVAFLAPWPRSSLTSDWIRGSWLKDPRAWIMIIDPAESDQVTEYAQTYQELVRLFCVENGFELERVIVLNNASQILPLLPFRYFGFPFLRTFDQRHSYVPLEPLPSLLGPFRPLIMTNYSWRPHRLMALTLICQQRLEDRIYLSFKNEPTQNYFQSQVFYQDLLDPDNQLEITNSDRIRTWHRMSTFRLDSVDRYYSTTEEIYGYYCQSLVSFTAETFYLEREIQITEKTYRNFLWYRPMVILASPGHLAEVRRQGFRTFDDFWDESYDLEQDPAQRLIKVMKIIRTIAYMSREECLILLDRMRPILDHNWHLVRQLDPSLGPQTCHQTLAQEITEHVERYYDHNQRL